MRKWMRKCQADPERATTTFAAAEASRVHCPFHQAVINRQDAPFSIDEFRVDAIEFISLKTKVETRPQHHVLPKKKNPS